MSESKDAAAPGAAVTASAATATPIIGAPALAVAASLGEAVYSSWEKRRDGTPTQLVPRFGRTQNARMEGGVLPVAVLSVSRLSPESDWTARVLIGKDEHLVAIRRDLSLEAAAEQAWREVCLAAGAVGAEG